MDSMNHLIERNEDALTHLLQEKAFDSLSGKEKSQVLGLMTEEEYHYLRELSVSARSAFQQTHQLVPRPTTRTIVKNRMRKQKAERRGLLRWNSFRNPAYQIAAGVAILALFVHFGNRPQQSLLPGGNNSHMFADSTTKDSSIQEGIDSFEDTVFSEWMRAKQ